jgi:hypothetical protein
MNGRWPDSITAGWLGKGQWTSRALQIQQRTASADQLLIEMILRLSFYRESTSTEQSLRCVKLPDLIMNAETISRVAAAIVGTTTKHLSNSNHVPTNYAPPINAKQNKLGIEFLGSHWEQPTMQARGPGFFSFGGGRVMLDFFCCCSHMFSICSHHILMNFHFSPAPKTCSPSAQSVPQRCGNAWDDCMQESWEWQ